MAAPAGAGRHPAGRRARVVREVLPAGALLGLAAVGLIGVGLRERDMLVAAVGSLAAAAVIVNLAWGTRLRPRVRVAVPQRAIAGESLPVLLRLEPGSRLGLPAMGVAVVVPGSRHNRPPVGSRFLPPNPNPNPGAGPTAQAAPPGRDADEPAATSVSAVAPLAAGDEQWLSLAVTLPARGPAGRVLATGVTTAPFGLIKNHWVAALDVDLVVWPVRRPPSPLPGGGLDGDRRAVGVDRLGSAPHGVREYRPGDDRRHVHWRSSARRGALVVVERERLLASDAAVLVLCPPLRALADPAAAAAHDEWEEAVARAAWSLAALAATGARVVVAAAGRHDVAARHLPAHDDVLDWFAGLPSAVEPPPPAVWDDDPPPEQVSVAPAHLAPGGGAGVPPDLADAVAALARVTRRGEQVAVLAAPAHPPAGVAAAGQALGATGRPPVDLRGWLR